MSICKEDLDEIKELLKDHVKTEREWQDSTSDRIDELMIDKRVRTILRRSAIILISVGSALLGIWKGLLPLVMHHK